MCADLVKYPAAVVAHSGSFDAMAGIMMDGTMLQQIARCDNERGYSCRVADFIKHLVEVKAEG